MASVLRRTSVLTDAMQLIRSQRGANQHVLAAQFFEYSGQQEPPVIVTKSKIVRGAVSVAVVRASHL